VNEITVRSFCQPIKETETANADLTACYPNPLN